MNTIEPVAVRLATIRWPTVPAARPCPWRCTASRHWSSRTSRRRYRSGRREEAVDLAPREEHEAAQHHERHRVGPPIWPSAKMPTPSSTKAMNMVCLAPDLVRHPAEERPATGRSGCGRCDSAKVSAGSVRPMRLTGISAILKSLAIGASCAVAIKPARRHHARTSHTSPRTPAS